MNDKANKNEIKRNGDDEEQEGDFDEGGKEEVRKIARKIKESGKESKQNESGKRRVKSKHEERREGELMKEM